MLLNCGVRKVPWVPLTVRRSNQYILKDISPEYSMEGLMLKVKLQYFGHLMERTDSLEKTLMLGKIERGRKRGEQRMKWLNGITNSMDMNLSKLWELVIGSLACCRTWGHKALDTTEGLNWTELKDDLLSFVRSKKWILEQYFSELEESSYVTYVTWNWNSELSPKYLKPLETQILFGDLHNEESHYFRRSSLKFQRVPMDSFKNSYIHFKSALSTANFTA